MDLSLSLKVQRGSQQAEVVQIRHNRVLVGKGAHCDIRLDDMAAAREQLELVIEGEQLTARSLSYERPTLLNGSPLVGTVRIEEGAELAILETRIVVGLVREANPQKASKTRRVITATLVAFILLLLPVVVYAAFRPAVEAPIGPPPPATPLWSEGKTTCKVEDKDQARHLAAQMRSLGDVSRERYPFDIQDGIHAVSAYEMAALCHRLAGEKTQAMIDDEFMAEIRDVVNSDYFAHRIRLEHAIESNDAHAAYVEVKILRQLTMDLQGPYIDWLVIVERRLEYSLREAAKEATSEL